MTHVFQIFTGPKRPVGGARGGTASDHSDGDTDSDSEDEAHDFFRKKFRAPASVLQELGSRITKLPNRRELNQEVPEEVFGVSVFEFWCCCFRNGI